MPNVDFVEVSLHLGKNAKKICFFRSACTNVDFVEVRLRLGKNTKKFAFFARLALTLHHQ